MQSCNHTKVILLIALPSTILKRFGKTHTKRAMLQPLNYTAHG